MNIQIAKIQFSGNYNPKKQNNSKHNHILNHKADSDSYTFNNKPNKNTKYNSLKLFLTSIGIATLLGCSTPKVPNPEEIFNSKDGAISETKQGTSGDCWLLSGVEALKNTQAGATIIKEALDYKENGTLVHLKGAGDYFISEKELQKAKESDLYSTGDDDMIILELAIKRVRDKIENGEIAFKDMRSGILFALNNYPSLSGGQTYESLYYLTGKTGEYSYGNKGKAQLLNNYIKNGGADYVIAAETNETKSLTDINGKCTTFFGPHTYTVSKIDTEKKTVEVINPWDTSKVVVLSQEEFIKGMDSIYGLDLSDKNPEQELLIETTCITITNEDGTIEKILKDKDGKILEKANISPDGNEDNYKIYGYDKDGNLSVTRKVTILHSYPPTVELDYIALNPVTTRETEYKYNEKTGRTEIVKDTKYEIDKSGKEIGRTESIYEKSILQSKTEISSDENGDLVKTVTRYDKDGETTTETKKYTYIDDNWVEIK